VDLTSHISRLDTFEEKILQDLRNGSIEAYEHIFNTHWKSLFSIANGRLRSETEAKEVVQELFIALWEKKDSLQINNLTNYLHTATRHRVFNKIRGKLREQKNWKFYQRYLPVHSDSTRDMVLFNDLNETIDEIVNVMPRKSQVIFKSSWMDGKSIPEIADQMRLSEKTIEYHLTKSMKLLRVHLKKLVFVILVYLTLGI
jgi:RNA polymerase sigma-70 factor (family 1)